jgi:hypothetical protein
LSFFKHVSETGSVSVIRCKGQKQGPISEIVSLKELKKMDSVQNNKQSCLLFLGEGELLRRIFGPKRDEMVGGWRKLHNELHNVYCLPNIIRMSKSRRKRWAGHAACMGEKRNAYKILVGMPEGKRPLGRPTHR